jgi:adenine-specific DNA methylase
MKPSEILRSLADMLDAKAKDQLPTLAKQPDDLFVAPLQLKLELLKKATDVENIYADEEEEQQEANSYDELAIIKRNAGISPVVLDALGDDEPLDV